MKGDPDVTHTIATHTIALVDDDQNILTSLSLALEAEGFTVRSYSNGAEALSALMSRPADLVLLDIKMPRMNGMEMLSQLRRHSNVPVIFLTSKDEEEDELEGLRSGADDYIKKPFSQSLLIERVRVLMRRAEIATLETRLRAPHPLKREPWPANGGSVARH